MRNERLNFYKGVACFGVVFIHATFPGVFGQLLVACARPAVALFFMIAGYYSYYESAENTVVKMRDRFKRNGKTALWAFAFYFVWGIVIRIAGKGLPGVKNWVLSLDAQSWLALLILNRDIIVGHLWFLLALLYCYGIMMLIAKKKCFNAAYAVGGIVLVLMIAVVEIMTFNGMSITISWYRNVWFYGMPVFLLGHLVHKKQDEINRVITERAADIIAIAGVVLSVAEWMFIGRVQIYFGSLLILLGVFLNSIRKPEIKKGKIIAEIGEKLSLDIYIYHWMVLDVYIKIEEILNLGNTSIFRWMLPLLVLVTSVIGSYVLNRVRLKLKESGK